MATPACQGLQSCLESQFMEQPVILRLKLASSIPSNPQTQCSSSPPSEVSTKTAQPQESQITKKPMSPEPGGWSFLQPYPKRGIFEDDFFAPASTSYSVPCNSSCSSILSEKSLELCTENLGNETGTEIVESSIFSKLGCEVTNLSSKEQTKLTSTQHFGANKKHVPRSFPPPLTTISGTESIQLRPNREDGRVVIKAIKTPSLFSPFQTERSHGRLRLCLLKFEGENEVQKDDDDEEENEDKEVDVEEEEVEGEEEGEEEISNMGNDNGGEEFEVENGVDGKNDNVGGKMGIEIFKTPERCKGSENRTLLNRQPFLVVS